MFEHIEVKHGVDVGVDISMQEISAHDAVFIGVCLSQGRFTRRELQPS